MKNLTSLCVTLIVFVSMYTLHMPKAQAQSLSGSRASMEKQHQHAVKHRYQFARTSREVTQLTDSGELVRVVAGRNIILHNVSYPYVRPQVKTLLERLSAQYYSACGERLTVTSMTRPIERQPANAARDSVHPTGMAFDLRIPSKGSCRTWLERTLLALEKSDVLDVTRERNPPHYHVAVFPEPYTQYVLAMSGQSREYIVQRGDTLTAIAARMESSVPQLRAANDLRGDFITIGQRLQVPGNSVAAVRATPADATSANNVAGAIAANTAATLAANAEPTEITHKVRKGETLWRIANRYRTSVNTLRAENDLADDLLRVGQELRIRASASASGG